MPRPMVPGPLCTIDTLAADLRHLGIQEDDILLVHSSLSSLGWVNGGAEAVVPALLRAVGDRGTLVAPTHSGDNSDPSGWQDPPVPEEWWQMIRDTMPVWDSRTTRTRGMGVIPETIRTWPGAIRSEHPQTSFTAIGPRAVEITQNHILDYSLGEQSPLGKLYKLNAKVLLLGVGFDTCTALHLAEYRVGRSASLVNKMLLQTDDGQREWLSKCDIEFVDSDFEQLGAAFAETPDVAVGRVGAAHTYLFGIKDVVDFAEDWMSTHRLPADQSQGD